MTSPRQNDIPDRVRNAEETLRMIAALPAPEGLSDRVQARLTAAPRRFFLTGWGSPGLNGWMFSPIMRGCAAAAIVLLVAGGGFAIYSRVQPSPNANVVLPARVGNSGGFSNAGAKRTPSTLDGPVLVHPAVPMQTPGQTNASAPAKAPVPQTKADTHKKKDTAGSNR
jgi:hypothetical protein